MLGQSLLHYTITGKLGEGGMGVVYKARDTHLDRFVAIKVLPPGRAADRERIRRFTQEAKSASALNHPNIVTIYDIATDGEVTFIAMEFVPGKALSDCIPRQGLPLAQTLQYAVQIADGLAQAHQAGIVHRDIKPGNIMVGEDGRVKILDFGLAKLTDPVELSASDATRTAGAVSEEGMIVGTAAYMSPEQAEGRKVDARSDIFSFGILLYEMLAGKKPFEGDTRMATISAVLRETPKPLSEAAHEIPRELQRVVDRCLRKDPSRRWQTMQDLRVALLDLKEESESGSLASPAKAAVATKRWPYAAAVLAVVAALGVWQFRPKAPEPAGDLVPVPLTVYPGDERDPAFSPDGNQIAFSMGPEGGVTNTFLKLIGPGDPIRLTTSASSERMSQWSRDGKWIAFGRRGRGVNDFVVMPALGGPEKVIVRSIATYITWTPDSQWLVITDGEPRSLFLVPLQGGEKKLLIGPLQGKDSVNAGTVSPDGRHLAVNFQTGDYRPLYAVPLATGYRAQGEPRLLVPPDWVVGSRAWTPDSKEIVFIRAIGDANAGGITYMYRVGLDGSAPKRIDYVGDNPWFLDVSLQGHRLAYTRLQRDINIHRLELDTDGTIRKTSEAIASSSRREENASYSPDGSRIVLTSNRTGSDELWLAGSDGQKLSQLTTSLYPDATRSPRWSPDGTQIAYATRPQGMNAPDIFVIPAAGGTPRQLTTDPGGDSLPAWSHDGKSIYFSSNRTGKVEIWKVPSEGGQASQVTRAGGIAPVESPDGQWLYFARGGTLYRMPSVGGDEQEVAKANSFLPTSRGVYAIVSDPGGRTATVRLLPISGGVPKILGKIARPFHNGLSLSPDFKYLLVSQYDVSSADIMLVENFR